MIRVVQLALVMVAGAVCFWLYQTKERAMSVRADIVSYEKKIADAHKAIALLRAEWATLNQPARLQALIGRYQARFKLVPLSPERMILWKDVPGRLPVVPRAPADNAATDTPLDRDGLSGLAAGREPAARKPE